MNAISSVSLRTLPEIQTHVHPLKKITLFRGLVLGFGNIYGNLRPGFERRVSLTRRRGAPAP
jgi:hypothetical protein